MANLLDIRRRIKSTKNTQQITKAMKMVSASRLRRASERATNARPYAERIFEVHQSVLQRMPEYEGELYRKKSGKLLVVYAAGDKGLCGSFNANIFKYMSRLVRDHGRDQIVALPIGKKAVAHAKKMEFEILAEFGDVFRAVDFALAETISNLVIDAYRGDQYRGVVIVFNKFRNVLVQDVTEWPLLPLSAESDVEPEGVEHLAEPSLEEILAELSPKVVMTRVFQALLESCAAEHAARMTAMEAATNNAKDLIGKLTLEMNKARQAAITKELIEVVSGAAAL